MSQELIEEFTLIYFQHFMKSFLVQDYHSSTSIEFIKPSYLYQQLKLGEEIAINKYHGKISSKTMKALKTFSQKCSSILNKKLYRYWFEYHQYLTKNTFNLSVLGINLNKKDGAIYLYKLLIDALNDAHLEIYQLFNQEIISLVKNDFTQSMHQPFTYSTFKIYHLLFVSMVIIMILLYPFIHTKNDPTRYDEHLALIEINKLKQEIEEIKNQQDSIQISTPEQHQNIELEISIQESELEPQKTIPQPLNRFKDIGIDMILFESGSFSMGSYQGNEDEKPSHLVKVDSFYISKTEVTVYQYRKCVEAGACSIENISNHSNCTWNKSDRHPITCVSWHQARSFALWLGGDLPSESQWEYAAKSKGKNHIYPWGNEEANCNLAIVELDGVGGCGHDSSWEVCSKPQGNTEQGLCDMGGNVWEWVLDEYHSSYKNAPQSGPWCSQENCQESKKARVGKGGGFSVGSINYTRTSAKTRSGSNSRSSSVGFRIVLNEK